MISHIFIGVSDFPRALAFYRALMPVLGVAERFCEPERPWAGWQSTPGPRPLLLVGTLSDGDAPEPTEAEIRALGRMAQDEQLATFAVGPGQLRRGVTAWILVTGAITAELFEQFGRDTYEPDPFFDLILDDAQRIVTG